LLLDPEILLLDEPFGALDEMTRESLDLEMMRIANDAGKTVVLVTHNVYEAALMADRIFVFTPRPGLITGVVEIEEPQPRTLAFSTTGEFGERVAQVRSLLSGESNDE
jgi:NitT/TauT family transport system ATP-binding protein